MQGVDGAWRRLDVEANTLPDACHFQEAVASRCARCKAPAVTAACMGCCRRKTMRRQRKSTMTARRREQELTSASRVQRLHSSWTALMGHGVRRADLRRVGLAQAQVLDLALLHQRLCVSHPMRVSDDAHVLTTKVFLRVATCRLLGTRQGRVAHTLLFCAGRGALHDLLTVSYPRHGIGKVAAPITD